MSNSPSISGTATFSISVNGIAIPDEVSIVSVKIEQELNRISKAAIVILDGDPNTGTFDVSSSSTFVPGAAVTVETGYDGYNTTIFEGIIISQQIKIDDIMGSTLVIGCQDLAVRMSVGKRCRTYSDMTDSDIVESIVNGYAGLSVKTVPYTRRSGQVQYNVTDWDYIVSIANANGLFVTTRNGLVSLLRPRDDRSSLITIHYGDNLMEFNATLNASEQFESIITKAWDSNTQSVISSEAISSQGGPGNLSTKNLSKVMDASPVSLQTSAALSERELSDWSNAAMMHSEYSKITGKAKFQGSAIPIPGKYITFSGLGDRFNGDHLVSGVLHELTAGDWYSTVRFGIDPQSAADIAGTLLASGSNAPGARGLFSGTVRQIADDPDGQYRILINMPLFDEQGTDIWARLATFYAGMHTGAFFIPEVGDEVVVGFLNEDARFPIILGSMYSSRQSPPYSATESNSTKAIVTKSGLRIAFDDTNKVLTIKTPGNNSITMNDRERTITVSDENTNSIVMSASGIEISAPKDIRIMAGQQITISAGIGINIGSDNCNVNINGADLRVASNGNLSAKASAQTRIEGSVVVIN